MKILQVGKYYPPFKGGMETVLRELSEGCLERGCRVTVITAAGRGEARVESLGEGSAGRLVRIPAVGVLHSQPLTLGLTRVLRREIDALEPDLVHLHLPNPLAAASWLALDLWPGAALPPLVVWYHADITRQRLGRWLVGPFVRSCLRRAVGVCVSSQALAESSSLLSDVGSKVKVIPFGIDPEPWIDLPGAGQGPFVFVGRLVPYKGLDTLIEAMGKLAEAELIIVGDGPERTRLEKQVAQDRLGHRIEFAGSMGPEELAATLSGARALVLPSLDRSETFGLVQLEAMAASVPVVTTALSTGVGRVGVPDVTCRVVPPADPVAMATALAGIVNDPVSARSMGQAGRRLFLEKYTRDRMITALLDWYRDLVGTVGAP